MDAPPTETEEKLARFLWGMATKDMAAQGIIVPTWDQSREGQLKRAYLKVARMTVLLLAETFQYFDTLEQVRKP